MSGGRRVGRWNLSFTCALFSGMTLASSAALATSPATKVPLVVLSLADDESSQRWYSVVPSDSPVLLPVKLDSSIALGIDMIKVAGLSARLRVDGDADGRVTDFGWKSGNGLEWTWTPGGREPGRTYSAHLTAEAGSQMPIPVPLNVVYGESTFEFTYVEATSAEFLPTARLALIDYSPSYALVGTKCCEVVASECAGAPSCHQCWDQEGRMLVGGTWDGSGIPYLTRSLRPDSDNLAYDSGSGFFQITERREYCIEGTATAAGESTTLTACGMPTVPPVYDPTGVQPVFAESCRVLPAGAHPMTLLVAARGVTEAEARELLEQQNTLPVPSGASPESSDALRCATGRRPPVHSGAALAFSGLSWSLLATIVWRRRARLSRMPNASPNSVGGQRPL